MIEYGYCDECGEKLKVIPIRRANSKFDFRTGKPNEPIYYYRYKCPKAHWWNTHTNFSTEPDYEDIA